MRRRNRAALHILGGIGLFLVALILLGIQNRGIPTVILAIGSILSAVGGFILYIGGCMKLAQAKGYEGGLVAGVMIFGALICPALLLTLPLIVAFVLKDKNQRHRSRKN